MVPSGSLQLNQTIEMVNEGITTITSLSPPMVNDANVVATDLMSGNGIFHVIDKVLNPLQTITDLAVSLPDTFSTLVDLVVLAGRDEVLQGEGPFTLFAPTNEAFAALDDATVQFLLNDTAALTDVLLYDVFPGIGLSGDLENGAVITMANNETTTIGATSASPMHHGNDTAIINAIETPTTVINAVEAPTKAPCMFARCLTAEITYFVNDAIVVFEDIRASGE
jgi:transforming growth factor-beta-induced protein